MLILYTKDNCQYCDKVKEAFAQGNVSYEERNIKYPEYLQEVQGYEARTMPFLWDTFTNTAVGESEDIIEYGTEYSF
ncbi:MAG: glutaredoxin family protein [Candidatus Paceibacterota bacterium]